MNIVRRMIEFRKSQELNYLGLNKCTDIENLNVIVINILSWLKLQRKRELWIEQGKKSKLKPLELNMIYSWCQDLEEYVHGENALADVFAVTDNELDFRVDISQEYVSEARIMAYEEYNPERMY